MPKIFEKRMKLRGVADMVKLTPKYLEQEAAKVFSEKEYAPVKMVDMGGEIAPMRAGSRFTIEHNQKNPDKEFGFRARTCPVRQRAQQACWERPATPPRPGSKSHRPR